MAKRQDPQTPPPDSPSGQIDADLAKAALEKRRRGQTPTARELAALRRIERQRDEQLRWTHYRTIPKKHWREMSGRQAKVLDEQALAHGIPFAGPVISLPDVVWALHDFLARNKHKLAAVDAGDPMDGPPSPALERWREEKWLLARLERWEREQSLIPRDQVHDGLARMAGILRTLGEAIQRHYGPGAHQLVDEALDDWQREIDRLFGLPDQAVSADPDSDGGGDDEPPEPAKSQRSEPADA